MNRIVSSLFFITLSSLHVLGQSYPTELLKYTAPQMVGTARSIGAGGAFSTVGADMGAALSNPAGLGLYRGSEISGSLALNFTQDKSVFGGSNLASKSTNFFLPHLGAVFAIPLKRPGQSTNFFQIGVVYQKTADFNREQAFNGINNANSKVDVYFNELTATNANIDYTNFSPEAVQAWNTYLVDTFNGSFFKRAYAPVNQSGYYSERGGANEVSLSLSGNINDKFYIGGALGLPWMKYSRTQLYSENIDYIDSVYGFQGFDQYSTYTVSGLGVNFKLGFIARPLDFWRVGVSITTPSIFFNLEEKSSLSTSARYTDLTQNLVFDSDTFLTAPYQFKYSRPLNATFGTSFIISKWGLISIDYQLTDYKNMRVGFDDVAKVAEDAYNKQISALYGIGHMVKVGGEFAWKVWRIRAGYNWQSTPFQSGIGVKGYDMQAHTATAGLGYRGKRFFADLAYARTMMNDYRSLYRTTVNEPGIQSKFVQNRIVATVGFRFGGKN